jgi:hypothetical protein
MRPGCCAARPIRKVLRQLREQHDGIGTAARVGEHHRLEEAHLRILWRRSEETIGTLESRIGLPGTMQTRDLGQLLGQGRKAGHRDREQEQQGENFEPGWHRRGTHCGQRNCAANAWTLAAILIRL